MVLLLESPFEEVVGAGLTAARPLLGKIVERKKAERFGPNNPDFEEVRNLLARANFALTGEFGDKIRAKLYEWMPEILEMDASTVLANNQLRGLRLTVERIEKLEERMSKKTGVAPSPVVNMIIETTDKEPRVRKDKPKNTFAGLPPVQVQRKDAAAIVDGLDTTGIEHDPKYKNRNNAPAPQRGVTKAKPRDGMGRAKR